MEKKELNSWVEKIAKNGIVSIDDDDIMYLFSEKVVEASELNYEGEKVRLQEIKDLLATKYDKCKRFVLNVKGANLQVTDVNDICNCFSPMIDESNFIWGYEIDPSEMDTKVLIIGSYWLFVEAICKIDM